MGAIINIFKLPELRRRVLFTLGMLAVYRLGVFIAVPGVDRRVMSDIVNQGSGGFLGYFNMFSGGALEQLSVFALGIMPYISASIIMQLMTVVIPKLEQLSKEGGETGRRKINQYSRYGTVGLACVQGYFMATWLESQNTAGQTLVLEPGFGFKAMTVLTLTAGTIFVMWLGEQITERGIGNGISLVIFAGIIANFPLAIYQLYQKQQDDPEAFGPATLAMLLAMAIAVIAFIVIMERGQRRITVQYAKRVVGKRMFGEQNYLPLKVNSAGVIPPIFASSILMFPNQIAGMTQNPILQSLAGALRYDGWLYLTVYVGLVIFFTYFYTAIQFNPVDVADNLKKQNAAIPGIRPGKRTAEYIDFILTRLTFAGSWYISAVCVLPTLLQTKFDVPFYYGGTSLLIVVGVALDTAQQIESHLVTRSYEGFAGPRGPRTRGRNG